MSSGACWASDAFRHAVLGTSLVGSAGGPQPPPAAAAIANALPSDSLNLIVRQLDLLSIWSPLPDTVKRAAGRCAASFRGSIDLIQPTAEAAVSPEKAVSFITMVVSRIRALSSGQALLLARGDPASSEGCTLFLVHRAAVAYAGSEFVVAVLASDSEALQYHPSRIHAASVRCSTRRRSCCATCRQSGVRRRILVPGAGGGSQVLEHHTLFDKLLPALNLKPALANWHCLGADGAASAEADRLGDPAAAGSTRLGDPASPQWLGGSTFAVTEGARSDPGGYDLLALAATVGLQLTAESEPSLPDASPGAPTYSPAGVALLLQHQLLLAAHADLDRLGYLRAGSPPIAPAVIELLTRASRRCSASPPRASSARRASARPSCAACNRSSTPQGGAGLAPRV